jgi:energy-converting hydrogenase Eha subunit E
MPDYLVRRSGTKKFTVTQEKTVVAENLSELADVSVSNLAGSDKFVLAYNASLAKFELIAADAVLTNAATDAVLPDSFVNQLDVDLDNKVDLDGGSF